jgi:hypothetical protein
MSNELQEIRKSMTGKMYCALTTGSHVGYTCIGQRVTLNALRRRGLIADDNRWTRLGWAMVLWIVATEPGWNPAYFKLPQDVHTEALAEDASRRDQRNSAS